MPRPPAKWFHFATLVAALWLFAFPGTASQAGLDYSGFARIPVLHEGRIKPLDSFARIELARIYGKPSLPQMTADAWLANALFDPAEARQQPWFHIASARLVQMLALPTRGGGLYSFNELATALDGHESLARELITRDRKSYSPDEQAFMALYESANDFAEITGTFSLLQPLADLDPQTAARLKVKSADDTYFDLLRVRKAITDDVVQTVKRKGDHLEQYTAAEKNMALLSFRMALLEAAGGHNTLMRIIPPFWEGSDEWLSPWAVMAKSAGSPEGNAAFAAWRNLAVAYKQQDAAAWQSNSQQLRAIAQHAATPVRTWALSLEVWYNRFAPLDLGLIAYALGLGLLLVAAVRRMDTRAAYAVMCVGAALHATAIICRMAILLRPPVGTLYESMIFVSLVAMGAGLWLARRRRSQEMLFLCAFTACALLFISRFFAPEGDTMGVLVAVLNTNFWLGTHVVCITAGYGSSLVAGGLAHLYLFRRAVYRESAQALSALYKSIYRVALVALLLTSVGTMLGGIWADQSWGRFWGWDPKENGALLIVLWLIWLLHARISGRVGDLGFAILMALLNIIVALAWVGVNLLSVGLHSYGFTDVAAKGLIAFCLCEGAIVTLMSGAVLYRNRRA